MDKFLKTLFERKKYTEADLETVGKEYVEATKGLNTVSFGAANFDEMETSKKIDRYHEARKKYEKIHRSLYPEKYENGDENTIIAYLPAVILNEEAKDLATFGLLAETEKE